MGFHDELAYVSLIQSLIFQDHYMNQMPSLSGEKLQNTGNIFLADNLALHHLSLGYYYIT